MTTTNPLIADFFFLVLGLSIVIDLIVLAGTIRALRIRRVRILSALTVIAAFVLLYLAFLLISLLGYTSFSAVYAGILLVFSILLVVYFMILKGMP